jgi:hypothetical protein
MASKIGRKAVYLGTIVGAVALVAGFAMAAVFTNTPVVSNQNGYSANFGSTIWATEQYAAPTLLPATSMNTCSATAANTASSPATGSFGVALGSSTTPTNPAAVFYFGMNGTVKSGIGAACSQNDFAEAWTLQISVSSVPASPAVDTFVMYATWTPVNEPVTSAVSADTVTMTISAGTGGSTQITVELVVDFGSNAPPVSITSMGVVVTGT